MRTPAGLVKIGAGAAAGAVRKGAGAASGAAQSGYKKQVQEVQDSHGGKENIAHEAGRTFENLAEKGARHVGKSAGKAARYSVRGGVKLVRFGMEKHAEKKAEKAAAEAKARAAEAAKAKAAQAARAAKAPPGQAPPTGKTPTAQAPAGGRNGTLSPDIAKRRMQIKRFQDYRNFRVRMHYNAMFRLQYAQRASIPKTPQAVQSAGAQLSNAPKTIEAVTRMEARAVSNSQAQVAAGSAATGAPGAAPSAQRQQRPRTPRQRPGAPRQAPGGPPRTLSRVPRQREQTAVKQQEYKLKKAGGTGPKTRKRAPASTSKRTLKAPRIAAKTRSAVQKTAAKQARKKVTQAARQEAVKRTVQATKAAVKFTIRALKLVIKAAAAAIKSLVALIGGGATVIVLVVIIAIVAALISSPFGLFFSDEDDSLDTTPISQAVQDLNQERTARIEEIKAEHSYVDSIQMHHEGSPDGADHWYDILAIFAVKTALDDENGMDVVTIDSTRLDLLAEVFWDMTSITYYVQEIYHPPEDDEDEDDEGWTEYILHITVTIKGAFQQAADYGFTDEQTELVHELLSGEYDDMFAALIAGTGTDGGGDLPIVEEGIYMWPSPVSTTITSYFGSRPNPTTGAPDNHTGIDIAAGYGTPVLAAASGTVTTASYDDDGYGIYVAIDHGGGNSTLYGHMSARHVEAGDTVTQGQQIGDVGDTGWTTGYHIHFETKVNGTRVDPLDYFSGY